METALPNVYVTNYQQYINAEYMQQAIADSLPIGQVLPENMYVSIAYMQVQRFAGIFKTVLVLSIKGKAYRFNVKHTNQDYYLAQCGLDLNNYSTQAAKDNHIQVYQQAFKEVVYRNIKQVVKAITTAYEN